MEYAYTKNSFLTPPSPTTPVMRVVYQTDDRPFYAGKSTDRSGKELHGLCLPIQQEFQATET
ncbi:hypothetical protein D3C74_508190 [compost metagenome]